MHILYIEGKHMKRICKYRVDFCKLDLSVCGFMERNHSRTEVDRVRVTARDIKRRER